MRTIAPLPTIFFQLALSVATLHLASSQPNDDICPAVYAARRRPWQDGQRTFTIGVLAIQGIDVAFNRFNSTFAEYLTATAGRQFDPPVNFVLQPVVNSELYNEMDKGSFDFIYVSPSPFACIDAQYGAQSLVSHVAKNVVGNTVYNLTEFAGVMVARSDRNDINSIFDIREKTVSAVSISGFAGAQLQFREMTQAGLSYINDPRQLVFTNNQQNTLRGVLSGRYDVGFIRTGIIERFIDDNGSLLDPTRLKIIEQKFNTIDGLPFPYVASTRLYPEWNLAALSHVPQQISAQVQDAMLALSEHAQVGYAIQECKERLGDGSLTSQMCDDVSIASPGRPRCDTTTEIAAIAARAMTDGRYAGYRTTLSYSEVSSLLLDNQFIEKDKESSTWRCVRSNQLYEAIKCPPGHFRRPKRSVDSGCANAGLLCNATVGETCLCKPCIKAFDVAVFQASNTKDLDNDHIEVVQDNQGNDFILGCAKMSICGQTQQTKPITFHAIDHKEMQNAIMQVTVHEGSETRNIIAAPIQDTNFTYHFEVSADRVGIVVIEITLNGEQIPESPLRVEVLKRDCASDFNDGTRVPDDGGECICKSGTAEIQGTCVDNSIIISAILVPVAILCLIFAHCQVRKHKRKADSVWLIKSKDLKFQNPPQVIGQGTFGLVLLAQYHGTQVAVKKVLPPAKNGKKGSGGRPNNNRKDSGSGAGTRQMERSLSTTQIQSDSDQRIVPMRPPAGEEHVLPETAPINDDDDRAQTMSVGTHDYSVDDMSVDTLRSNDVIFGDVESRAGPMAKWGRGKFDRRGSHDNMTSFDADSLAKLMDGKMVGRTSAVLNARKNKKERTTEERGTMSSGKLSDGSGRNSDSKGSSNGSSFLGFRNSSSIAAQKEEFMQEMRTISKLRHPNITTVMGAVISKNSEPMLVMEYLACGSLHDLLHNESMVLNGDMMLNILQDIAQGVRFLHSSSPIIVHGDLKSANILISNKLQAKVADFGLSSKTKKASARGTPYWMAPELLRGETANTTASDIYSMGIIVYETYSRKNPYEGERYSEVIRLVCDKKVNKRPPVPALCPPKVAKLMKFMLMANPTLRPNAEALDNRLNDIDTNSDLLHQIFPKHIAKVLAVGGKVDPQSHELVTIFFSDIIGFVTMASTLSPLKVSSLLDRLYMAFDGAARRHEVFKIETIGDSYMCVTNLSGDQDHDHAERIAEFAIEVVRIAAETLIDEDDPTRGYVAIRAGFHSGPVVSNVIGSLNPRFSLFGDTVNVASRMESTSESGRIQCTEQSYSLLRTQAPLIPMKKRGDTDVKGKGSIKAYWCNEWS